MIFSSAAGNHWAQIGAYVLDTVDDSVGDEEISLNMAHYLFFLFLCVETKCKIP
jgi:hypothetical protein